MDKTPVLLFVYGTLRPGFTNAHARLLHRYTEYVGEGLLAGRLFDIGSYPGATHEPDGHTFVRGAVYDISNNPTILTRLDRYEGVSTPPNANDEYVRAIVPVRVGEQQFLCWTYLYNWPLTGKPLIDTGDYLLFKV